MSRYGSNMHREHCPCNRRNHREGLLGDKFDRYNNDDRYNMRDRHGLQGGRYDDMYDRRDMEYGRKKRRRDCC